MLTPYQFASNTPIEAIDLDGLEAFYVHGTWADPTFFSSPTLKIQVPKIFNNSKAIEFDWSPADNDVFTRLYAGFNLAMQIKNERIVSEPITIMAHSHGGNVAKIAINILTQQFNVNPSDINLITLNMPSRSDYKINDDAQFGVFHVNISSRIDLVQFSGGNDNIFEGGKNRFSFGGDIDEKADYNIFITIKSNYLMNQDVVYLVIAD